MTPEEKQMLTELYEWMKARKTQQLSLPVDDASRNALRAAIATGGSSTTLTQIYTDSRGDTLTGPKAYAGSIFLIIDGVIRELPYL